MNSDQAEARENGIWSSSIASLSLKTVITEPNLHEYLWYFLISLPAFSLPSCLILREQIYTKTSPNIPYLCQLLYYEKYLSFAAPQCL